MGITLDKLQALGLWCRVIVTAVRREGQTIAVDMDVSCKNQHGEPVTIGTATGTIDGG